MCGPGAHELRFGRLQLQGLRVVPTRLGEVAGAAQRARGRRAAHARFDLHHTQCSGVSGAPSTECTGI